MDQRQHTACLRPQLGIALMSGCMLGLLLLLLLLRDLAMHMATF
jgi:hypothetical protein